MQHFLYRLTLTEKYRDPSAWTEETNKIILDHFNWMKTLGERGILIFAGRTDFTPDHKDLFGIALINAGSLEEAKSMMKDDPGVTGGVQQQEIFPFRLALSYFHHAQ